jgi:hypothetical protein
MSLISYSSNPQAKDQLMLKARDVEDIYTLSPIQEGILFHALSNERSRVFLEQGIATMVGTLDTRAFELAWREIAHRHPILRTSFLWKMVKKPIQIVHREVELPFVHMDRRTTPSSEQNNLLHDLIRTERSMGVQLDRAPLMRIVLVHTADDRHEFIWTIHHLIHDSWSTSILMDEVLRLYSLEVHGTPVFLASARPYRDYVSWMKKRDFSASQVFWRAYLRDVHEATPLPVVRTPSPDAAREDHDRKETILSEDATDRLRLFARKTGVTLNTVVQGMWAILLSFYSERQEVLYGRVVSGRPPEIAGVESMIGPFINTLPLKIRIAPQQLVAIWLKEIQRGQLQQSEFEHAPLARIQRWSGLPRGVRLFDSILVFQNSFTEMSGKTICGIEITGVYYEGYPNYPLMTRVWPAKRLRLEISYARGAFDVQTISEMLLGLQYLLTFAAEHENVLVAALSDGLAQRVKQERKLAARQRREAITAKLQKVAGR